MERNTRPNGAENECSAQADVANIKIYLNKILQFTLDISQRIMLLNTNVRIALYLSGLLFLPLVGGFLPSLECCSFCSTLSESFNCYFVEMAWEWTLLLVVPFMLLESYVLSGGDIKKPLQCQLPRVCVTTCSWLVWLKIFKIIEQGSLRGCPLMGLIMKCHCRRRCCRVSSGLRISGHTFILIQSSLMLVEEARALLNFKAVKAQLCQELHNRHDGEYSDANMLRDFDDAQLENLANLYGSLGPVVHVLFLCMGLLQLFWDAMLFSSMLYYHSMIEKILGGVTAMLMWWIIYRFWYNTCALEDLLDSQTFPFRPDGITSPTHFNDYPATDGRDLTTGSWGLPRALESLFSPGQTAEYNNEPTCQATNQSTLEQTRSASSSSAKAAFRDVFTTNPLYSASITAPGNRQPGGPKIIVRRISRDIGFTPGTVSTPIQDLFTTKPTTKNTCSAHSSLNTPSNKCPVGPKNIVPSVSREMDHSRRACSSPTPDFFPANPGPKGACSPHSSTNAIPQNRSNIRRCYIPEKNANSGRCCMAEELSNNQCPCIVAENSNTQPCAIPQELFNTQRRFIPENNPNTQRCCMPEQISNTQCPCKITEQSNTNHCPSPGEVPNAPCCTTPYEVFNTQPCPIPPAPPCTPPNNACDPPKVTPCAPLPERSQSSNRVPYNTIPGLFSDECKNIACKDTSPKLPTMDAYRDCYQKSMCAFPTPPCPPFKQSPPPAQKPKPKTTRRCSPVLVTKTDPELYAIFRSNQGGSKSNYNCLNCCEDSEGRPLKY